MIEWYILIIVSAISYILGTVLHEFGHKIFCNLTGVKVIGVSYFNLDEGIEADGFVIHENPKTFTQSLLITLGPFFSVGLVLFLILLFLINSPWLQSFELLILVLMLGFGISMFPSRHDINNLIEFIKKNHKISNKQSFLQNAKTIIIWLFLPAVYILKFCSRLYVKIIIVMIALFIFLALFF